MNKTLDLYQSGLAEVRAALKKIQFFVSKEIPFISDCIAPFSIDIEFDEWSDMGAADPTAPTMDPNDFTSCGKFSLL